jgi:hypothetical protein
MKLTWAKLTPDMVARQMAKAISDGIEAAVTPLAKRLDQLEKQSAETKFCGVYQRALTYQRNNFVAEKGTLWCCVKDAPAGRPGESPDWQLVVQKGRDGRDVRA